MPSILIAHTASEMYNNYSGLCMKFVQDEFSENYANEFIDHVQSLVSLK